MSTVKETYRIADSYFFIGDAGILMIALILVLVFIYISLMKRRS